VILRYRVSRPGKFPIPNCEVQCPAVSPKELRIGAVYCGLVRFTADRGGGFRTKPELEKQATLVYCGLLRMDKAEAGPGSFNHEICEIHKRKKA
jgi:hypothetical protein